MQPEPSIHLVIAVGPLSGTVTGQQQAFSTYINHSRHRIVVVDVNSEGRSAFGRAGTTFVVVTSFLKQVLRYRKQKPTLYLLTSRSLLGSIKDILILAIAKTANIRVINHVHGAAFEEFVRSCPLVWRMALRWSYRDISDTIVLDPGLAKIYSRFSPISKIHIIPNYTNLPRSENVERQSTSEIRIAFLSNLFPEKGVLEAMKGVHQFQALNQCKVRMRIGGGFPPSVSAAYESSVRLSAEGFGFDLLGQLDRSGCRDLLAWAHYFLFPSRMQGEAMPLAVLEAMGQGCVPIVSDVGFAPELVRRCGGTVLASVTSENIAQALSHLHGQHATWSMRSNRIANLIASEYSVDKFTGAIDRVVDTTKP